MQDYENSTITLTNTTPSAPHFTDGTEGIITASNLKKIYGGITVLNIPSIQIRNSESFGLVGNNGAGKTTFFQLILDLIEASSGEVLIEGEKVARRDEWKSKVGSFLDEGFLIDFLTPEEYFTFTAKVYHKSEGDLASFLESMKDFFNGEIVGSGKLIRDLSKGNQKKTGIAAALISGTAVSLLGKEGTAATLGKFLAGIFLILTVASPLVRLSTDGWTDFWSDFSLEGEYVSQQGKNLAILAQADIIKPQLEAYILDKAASLGTDLTAEVTLNTETLTPESVKLTGSVSPYAKQQLRTFLEETLGIPKEAQQWISTS